MSLLEYELSRARIQDVERDLRMAVQIRDARRARRGAHARITRIRTLLAR